MRSRFAVLIILLLAVASAHGQMYPRWFLFQGEIPSAAIGAGFVHPSVFRDSSTAYAFRAGCTSYAMYRRMSITGSDAFWSTEGGTAWMGSQIDVSYDTSLAEQAQARFTVLAQYHDKAKTLVLAGDSGVALGDGMQQVVRMSSIPMPEWVERLPDEPHMLYAVGESEDYFHETSSWEQAEKIARLSLGRQLGISVMSMQKLDDIEGQDVRDASFSAVLRNVRVVARWRDMKKKIFYVLVSMPH